LSWRFRNGSAVGGDEEANGLFLTKDPFLPKVGDPGAPGFGLGDRDLIFFLRDPKREAISVFAADSRSTGIWSSRRTVYQF
jgi:hypothetical protein